MRSTSSQRALSISTPTRDVARSFCNTCMPPIPGSTTSKTTITYRRDSERSRLCFPAWTDSTTRSSSARHSPTRLHSSRSSSMTSTRFIFEITPDVLHRQETTMHVQAQRQPRSPGAFFVNDCKYDCQDTYTSSPPLDQSCMNL